MTTAKQSYFKIMSEEIINKKLSEPARFNISVTLFDLVKKAATDRQWVVKHLPYNQDLLDLFKVFIEQELKPNVHAAALQELDCSGNIASLVTTHHKTLRNAFEDLIAQQLEQLQGFEFNIERDSMLTLKKVLFYLSFTLGIETTSESLQKLLQTVKDRFAQDLFFTSTYLLMNQEKVQAFSRIRLEWLASLFLSQEKAPVIEYVIGHWTRAALIHHLINQALKAPQKEPETDEEKEMVREIIFSTKQEAKK